MNELTAWLAREADRERRTPYLEDALLGDRFWPYAFRRLRYFLARYAVEAVLHGIRVLLLQQAFSRRTFVGLLMVHAIATFVSSTWWGALESLRERVRVLYRSGRQRRIPREIGRWLTLSFAVAIVTLIAGAAWLVLERRRSVDSGAALLYSGSIVLGLALQIVSRTFHSGVYAVRRIYRPLPAIFAVELASFAVILVFWRAWGAWSLAVGSLFASLLAAAFVFHYTARAYRFLQMMPTDLMDLRGARAAWSALRKGLLGSGLSYALVRLDAVLVLLLFPGSARRDAALGLYGLFFLISPTIRAGSDWAQLFYFDLKRLDLSLFRSLRGRFESHVLRLSVVLGVTFWAAAMGTAALFYPADVRLLGLLLPFFLCRSLLAFAQIKAFSHGAYADLLRTGALWLVAFLLIRARHDGDPERLVLITVVTLLVFGLLRGHSDSAATTGGGLLPVAEWLARLKAIEGPVRICSLRFGGQDPFDGSGGVQQWDAENRWNQRQVAGMMAQRLGRAGAVALIHPGRVVWFETRTGAPKLEAAWVISVTGGLLAGLDDVGLHEGGVAALASAQGRALLGRPTWTGGAASDVLPPDEALAATFSRLFPEGTIYRPDRPAPATLARLPSRDKRAILHDATGFAMSFRPSLRHSRFDVTASCRDGEIRAIFVVEGRDNRRLRARFRALVKRSTIDSPPRVP